MRKEWDYEWGRGASLNVEWKRGSGGRMSKFFGLDGVIGVV